MSNFKSFEDYQSAEKLIIKYLEEYQNIEGDIETEELKDTSKQAVIFRGRPTAVVRDGGNIIKTLVKVKIVPYGEYKRSDTRPGPSYVLEVVLLLYLAQIDSGYLCVCSQKHPKQEIGNFKSDLQQQQIYIDEEIVTQLSPRLTGISGIPLIYEIQEFGCNKPRSSDPTIKLGKIGIKRKNIDMIVTALDSGGDEFRFVSPEMNKKERKVTYKFFKKEVKG